VVQSEAAAWAFAPNRLSEIKAAAPAFKQRMRAP
jgi:hypothetical protein